MAKEEVKDSRLDAETVPTDKKDGEKLDKILSHLDSIHTALADTNARMDAFESGKFGSRKDAEKDVDHGEGEQEGGGEKGEPKGLVADRKDREERKDRGVKAMKDAEEEDETSEEKEKAPEEEKDLEEEEEGSGEDKNAVKYDAAEEEKEEERKDARRDARHDSLDSRLTKMERRLAPRSNADRAKFAEFQAAADKVFSAFSISDAAPRALDGESFTGYQQRLLSKLKTHSSAWKTVNLYDVRDSKILKLAADQIFADAYQEALHPATPQPGVLRAVEERDQTGRKITRFFGDPEATWGMFKQQPRRLTGINLKPNG
jgi:hypothetical protein